MRERLLGFLFFGILLAYAVNIAADKIHAHFFADSLWFQAHWYLPFVILPAASLLALAWSFGFFRAGRPRWADIAAIAITALLVYLTLGASYSCWHYCF
jgi:hypothetical protein